MITLARFLTGIGAALAAPHLAQAQDSAPTRVVVPFAAGEPADLVARTLAARMGEARVRAHRIERIFCSGVSTVTVVQGTVRDMHDRDYVITVLEDCCACPTAEDHEAAIRALQRFATFTTADAVDFSA